MSLLNARELQPFVVADVRLTGRVLGEGSYGSVEEAEIPGATCVVKKLHEALLPPPTEAHGADRMAATFVAECRLMSTVRHPHIVQFLGVCLLPGSRLPALIMEKLLIDLHNLLENNSAIPLSMKHSILLGVSKGLTVLLNSAMVAKIADLGNSRIINVRPSQLMTMTMQEPRQHVVHATRSSGRYLKIQHDHRCIFFRQSHPLHLDTRISKRQASNIHRPQYR